MKMANFEAFCRGFWSVWDFTRPFSEKPVLYKDEELAAKYERFQKSKASVPKIETNGKKNYHYYTRNLAVEPNFAQSGLNPRCAFHPPRAALFNRREHPTRQGEVGFDLYSLGFEEKEF